ncbi:MAG: hypothetical protein RL693_1699 [Verrucomicrobiota bacterium]
MRLLNFLFRIFMDKMTGRGESKNTFRTQDYALNHTVSIKL